MTEINYWRLYDATSGKDYWISITDEKSEYGNYYVDSEDVGHFAKDYDDYLDPYSMSTFDEIAEDVDYFITGV